MLARERMMSLIRGGSRPLLALAVATCAAAGPIGVLSVSAAVHSAPASAETAGIAGTHWVQDMRAAPSPDQRYVTLFFSRSEITAADGCQPDDQGIARLDTTVAPFLASMGMSGTGSLITGRTKQTGYQCGRGGDTLNASWAQATAPAQGFGWSFVSAT